MSVTPKNVCVSIARVAHEINRAYCDSIGDHTQVVWENAPDWQKQSAIKGVEFIIGNPDAVPGDSHKSWLKEKEETGWKYGAYKDPDAKLHPCIVPFEELPKEQQIKDHLFVATVRAIAWEITRPAT